jgi:cyclopropane fatty-acyl-phospholipid synthase-like methyltransferase
MINYLKGGFAMEKETVLKEEDLLVMLDALLKENSRFNWDDFYKDRGKKIPFFKNIPDENLVRAFEEKLLLPGRVLELGCGPGRNAVYFAKQGCSVDAVDFSEEGLKWGEERARQERVSITFIHQNIFDLNVEEGTYDIVYDSGCFHHIPPHRRPAFIQLVQKALKPGGIFGLTCFVVGGEFGGSALSDWDVYRLRSMKGGLGYTSEKLKAIFRDFDVLEIRRMREMGENANAFGLADLLFGFFKAKPKKL